MFISTIQRLYQTDIIRKAFFKLKKGENTFKVQDIKCVGGTLYLDKVGIYLLA